jgi:SOS-response transcriptional repressor LexA
MGRKTTLTEKRIAILQYISNYNRRFGFSPSTGEIVERFNLASTNGARKHIKALVTLGYIAHEPRSKRSLTVIKLPEETVNG